MVLVDDGEVPLDRSCEKLSIAYSQGGGDYHLYNKKGRLIELVTSRVRTAF